MSAIAKRPDAYEHVAARLGRQRHPLRRVGAGGQVDARCSRPRSSGSTLDGPQLNDVVDTLKRMEHEGYHFEVADASLELLMRRAGGLGAGLVRGRVVPGDHRRRRPGRRRPGGVTTEATIKVHVGGERVDRDRRGQRPGERARHRAAPRARRPLPGARPRCTSPTTRCGCSTPPRAPARSPGCSSTPPTATARGRRSA